MSQPKPDPSLPEEYAAEDDAVIGRALKGSLLALAAIVAIVALVFVLRSGDEPPETIIAKELQAPAKLVQKSATMPRVRFTDVTTTAGISFRHTSGASGDKLLPETMGSGAAFVDYDNDDDPDLLLINATHWHSTDQLPTLALYRNDGRGKFQDVTTTAGLAISLYGQGVATGDVDGDGDRDLFVTAVGTNRLLRNDGDRFTDATEAAGVGGRSEDWSTSAGMFDYDNDGDLDLFVCNYVAWSPAIDRAIGFTLNGVDRAYGPPKNFEGSHSYLYRNDGAGRFTDVSAAAGIQVVNRFSGQPAGKALALAIADFDGDGFSDVFVANDTVQNFLFHNLGNGTFEEIGASAGLAYDGMGNATGAMGADAADYRNEGALGVAVGNFANETTSLYTAQAGSLEFADMADVEGIGSPSRLRLSFGLFFFDYDLDGRLDLFQANGHLEEEINQIQPSQHYEQPPQLFWNAGPDATSCFLEVQGDDGGDLTASMVGRAATYADIDGDGDLDVLLTQPGREPRLLRNDQQLGHHWLRVQLRGRPGNSDGIGSWLELVAEGVRQRRQVMPTRSYLSQVEPIVTFGLGAAEQVESLQVTWPDGKVAAVAVPGVDRTLTVAYPADSAGP